MQVFSRSPKGYAALLKWGALAVLVIGFLRFVMQPIGVPIAMGGMATSITLALLLSLAAYGGFLAWNGGTLGDVVVVAAVLVLVYNVVLTLFLGTSHGMGIETYYLDTAHVGENPDIPRHLIAHYAAIPFTLAIASVIGGIVYGIVWVARRMRGGAVNARPA